MGMIKLGKVAFTPKGVYNEGVSYAKYDMVFKDLMAYISLDDGNVGHQLTDTKYWTPFIGVMEVNDTLLADGCVTTDKIVNGAVNTDKLANDSVTTEKLQNGVVDKFKLEDGAVTTPKIADGAVHREHIGDDQITTVKILNGAVGTDQIANAAITEDKLSGGRIVIDDESVNTLPCVTSSKIKDSNVTTAKLSGGEYVIGDTTYNTLPCVTEQKIANGAVTEGKLSGGEYDGQTTLPCVTTDKLHDNAVTTAKIRDDAVTTDKLSGNYDSGNEEWITPPCVTTDKIKDLNVTTDKIADLNVTEDKLSGSTDPITHQFITLPAVTEDKIANGAVKTDKIGTGAVTTAKIEDYDRNATNPTGVTTEKIGTGAVTTEKLHNEAVTTEKIRNYTTGDTGVTTPKIADGAVTTIKIANGAVTRDKLDDDSVSDLTSLYDTFQAQIAALASDYKVSGNVKDANNANAISCIYKGVQQTFYLNGSMSNAPSGTGVTYAMALKDGATELETSSTTSISKKMENQTISADSKTYTVEGTTLELTKKASITINARYPIYVGCGTSAAAVAVDANKLTARTSAAGTYTKSTTANGQHLYIIVPPDVPALSSFTMGGAPFLMTATTDTINGIADYKIYESTNTYNSGTQLKVTAS